MTKSFWFIFVLIVVLASCSKEEETTVPDLGHDYAGFLLLLWIDSTYLSIGIPVRKQRKSHKTAVKHLLERHSLSSKGEARAKF